jgi:hypothetical protein
MVLRRQNPNSMLVVFAGGHGAAAFMKSMMGMK